MMEEESGALPETAPAHNIRKTIISLVILALITAGLLLWWLPRRAAENVTATKTEEKPVEKKEPVKPRFVVDVYRGDKHVQEIFQ